jgi:hypothetical protein
VQLLKNRLLLADLLARHPEIAAIPIARPIVICGLPRTGTTHLHNLMAADPALRSLPYWESLEPIPQPAEAGVDPDPRLTRCEMSVQFINQAMPHFRRMHEMTTWHVHEEIQLLAMDCSTMLFESLTPIPEWRDYYLAHDQTPQLPLPEDGSAGAAVPARRPALGTEVAAAPGAVRAAGHGLSRCHLRRHASRSGRGGHVDGYHGHVQRPHDARRDRSGALRRLLGARLETMLRACVRDRDRLPPAQTIDVRFDDFMADDIAMVRRIYALAAQPFDASVATAMTAYMTEHPQGRHGRVDYRPADVGLERADLERRFAFYTQRFLA